MSLKRTTLIWHILLIAFVYAIAGRIGQLVGVPPGNVTLIWLPSGVAFFVLLYLGNYSLIGIWLGAVAAIAWFFWDASSVESILKMLAASSMIGLGSVLQPLCGKKLLRLQDPRNMFSSPKQTFCFLGVVPVMCLVSSTIGTLSLCIIGFAEWSTFWSVWQTWWVGDSLGILVVVPVATYWVVNLSHLSLTNKLTLLFPLVLTIVITLVVFFSTKHNEIATIQLRFETEAEKKVAAIERTLKKNMTYIDALGGMISVIGHSITLDQFQTYSRTITEQTPSLQAMEWLPIIPHSQRNLFEEMASKQWGQIFEIKEKDNNTMAPAKTRESYMPVYLVEPLEGNEEALGYDIASDPERLHTVDLAIRLNQKPLSPPIVLVQEAEQSYGFLYLVPVTISQALHDNQQTFSGVALGVFRVDTVVSNFRKTLGEQGVSLKIIDRDRITQQETVIYEHQPTTNALTVQPSLFEHRKTIDIGGRDWSFHFWAGEAFIPPGSFKLPKVILFGGYIFCALLALLLITMRGRVENDQKYKDDLEQQVQERTKALTETQNIARLGQWQLNLKTNELSWSDEVFRIFEIDKNEFSASYEAFLNAIHPDDRGKVNAAYTKSLEDKKPYEIIHRLLMKDGSIKYLRELCRNEFDDDGTLLRSLGAVQDITELKQAENRYKEANKQLIQAKNDAEAANLAKSVFLSNMSHELRTPLNAVLGFSEILAHDPQLNEKQKENLEIINRSGSRLLVLINNILDMSKIEAGRIELEFKPVDLHFLLRDIGDMMRPRVEAKHLQFALELAPRLPQYVQLDMEKFRQVLINLLDNAIKFAKTGGVILRADADDVSSGEWQLRFEVEDSGIGIPADEIGTIFEPFIQADRSANEQQGTGLGLAISRQLIHLMGGDISVQSTINKGSIFRFEIPADVAEANADVDEMKQQIEETRQRVIGLAVDEPEWRILVVEDDSNNRLLLSRQLDFVGFKVREAVNGSEAIQQFEDWHPHFIWMDIRMPVMDGYEATRRIRALPGGEQVIILALTASAFKNQEERILAAGCNAALHKPYNESDVFTAMGEQLGLHYIYEERDESLNQESLAKLERDDLQGLPDEWLVKFLTLVRLGDINAMLMHTDTLAAEHAEAKAKLNHYIHEFQFQNLIKILEDKLGPTEKV
jgi:PAS domain S-box-containing protein